MLWGYSPALDLCLCAKDRRLKFFDRKTGRYLPTIAEQRAALSEEQTAHRQTAAERDAAQAEVDRLREELRRLQGR
jgi:multidrug efflux pump subunit AcrA (membrane-fusion protein)